MEKIGTDLLGHNLLMFGGRGLSCSFCGLDVIPELTLDAQSVCDQVSLRGENISFCSMLSFYKIVLSLLL